MSAWLKRDRKAARSESRARGVAPRPNSSGFTCCCIAWFAAFTATRLPGEEWPQWRGPQSDGASLTADPPIRWGSDQNIRWKTAVPGSGSSTPIVYGSRIFLLSAIPTDKPAPAASVDPPSFPPGTFNNHPSPDVYYQFVVLCYDRATGQERWRSIAAEQVPHEPGHVTNTFASSSPVADGESLFVSFGSRGIYRFNVDGKPVWSRDLGRMQTRRDYGEAASSALHNGVLVVPWDHEEQSYLYALDASTGRTLWRVTREEPTTWATPLIVDHKGRTQVITNGTTVRSYDLKTGNLIWKCGGQVSNPIPCPVAKDGVVYCMTGYRGNAVYAISLDAKGDITESRDGVLWSRSDAAPYIASPVLYRDRLYLTKSRNAIVSSLDLKTGQPKIAQQRLSSMRTLYASPIAAAGRVYFFSREGVTTVIEHADSLQVLAQNNLGEPMDASPAMVDDQLFLRGRDHLYCIGNAE